MGVKALRSESFQRRRSDLGRLLERCSLRGSNGGASRCRRSSAHIGAACVVECRFSRPRYPPYLPRETERERERERERGKRVLSLVFGQRERERVAPLALETGALRRRMSRASARGPRARANAQRSRTARRRAASRAAAAEACDRASGGGATYVNAPSCERASERAARERERERESSRARGNRV